MIRKFSAAALSLLAIGGLTLGLGQTAASASSGKPLVGTFKLTNGACFGAAVTGTYFRMIFPKGNIKTGQFFQDPDSLCPNKTFILATPGTDGGFETGKFQPNPKPAFTSTGGALADEIIQPQSFTGIDFSLATSRVDPQQGNLCPRRASSIPMASCQDRSKRGRCRGTSSISIWVRPSRTVGYRV